MMHLQVNDLMTELLGFLKWCLRSICVSSNQNPIDILNRLNEC